MKTYRYFVYPKKGQRFEVEAKAISPSQGKKQVEAMYSNCRVAWAGRV